MAERNPKSIEINNIIRSVHKKIDRYNKEEFQTKVAPDLPPNQAVMEGSELGEKDYADDQWREYRYVYQQLVTLVDSHIGVVLDVFDANHALKKETIVVFTSDHGEMQGAHRAITKMRPFNECQQVPLVFMGKGIAKGKVNQDAMVSGIDMIQTLCDLVGIDATGDYQGVSIADVVLGKSKVVDRDSLFGEAGSFLNILHKDYKYTYMDKYKQSNCILVDLKNDPYESANLLLTEPNKYNNIAETLKAEILNWQASMTKAK